VKKKRISSSKVLLELSKHLAFLSLHKHHIRHRWIIFHTTARRERPPDHQQPNKSPTPVRHNPKQPKLTKDSMLESTCNLTMKKKVIYSLSVLLTHTTPIHYHNIPLMQIIMSQNFAESRSPPEESHSQWHLSTLDTLPRKHLVVKVGQGFIE
jgi:hypothetical protein